jgi:ABC-type glycerol-3-phosphate transport system permease component
MFSSLKREFKMGGRPYRLARSKEIVGQVARLEEGRSHVRLLADMSNTQQSHLAGAATMLGAGGIATAIGITLGVAVPVAMIPAALGFLTGFALARRRRGQVEETQIAMEQVLDRLERNEISFRRLADREKPGTLERLASEIRKNFGV